MTETLVAVPLTDEAFAPFGDVLAPREVPSMMINAGQCGRHHDLARLDFGGDGRPGISIFDAEPRSLPYTLTMVERHPHGSQAFIPMTQNPFLVIVAPDRGRVPGDPLAFVTQPGQGVNFHRGTWHGVLTPLQGPGLFAVVDWIGEGENVEEYDYAEPWVVID